MSLTHAINFYMCDMIGNSLGGVGSCSYRGLELMTGLQVGDAVRCHWLSPCLRVQEPGDQRVSLEARGQRVTLGVEKCLLRSWSWFEIGH